MSGIYDDLAEAYDAGATALSGALEDASQAVAAAQAEYEAADAEAGGGA